MSSDLIYISKETVDTLVNEEMRLQLESLVEHLEDDPDCVRVWTTPHRSSDEALTASIS